MKRVLALLVVAVFTLTQTSAAFAISRSSSRSYSAPRSSSRPSGYNQPINTSRPAPKPKAWSSTQKYGATKSQRVGKKPLSSRTPAPQPHTFNGRTYQSSKAIYTNTSGNWVLYFITGALVANAIGDHSKEVHCFDEKHKEIKCDRDEKSYQKDW